MSQNHREHHERDLWPGAVACVDVVPETLGIAGSALGNGGQGQAVGLGYTCLKTDSQCHEHYLLGGAVACIDVVPKIPVIAWAVKFTLRNGGGG